MNNLRSALMPDTKIVKEANQILLGAASTGMYNHSLRVNYLATKYAQRYHIDYDEEQLALACLFHDLGLTNEFYHSDRAFIYSSSQALKNFLLEKGYEKHHIAPLMDAINFHFEIMPRWKLGNLAGLLQVGAWMDVTGLKWWNMPGERSEARRRFKAKGFFLHFNACLVKQLISPKRAKGILLPERNKPSSLGGCCH